MEAGMSDLDITFRDVIARDDRDWVNFGRSYVTSESFKALFSDGMALVEETAAYLDGEGRDEARLISREATLAYAGESMKLTTRLMQIASWLLVQRAVAEGEISLGQALEEKRRVKLTAPERGVPVPATDEVLPERLLDLIERSHRLHTRILHLDALVCDDRPSAEPHSSPVAAQVGLLANAFARG